MSHVGVTGAQPTCGVRGVPGKRISSPLLAEQSEAISDSSGAPHP
jgi:hypothetical protein